MNNNNLKTINNISTKFKEIIKKIISSKNIQYRIKEIKDTKINLNDIRDILHIKDQINSINIDILRKIYNYLKEEKIILNQELIDDLLEVYKTNKLCQRENELNERIIILEEKLKLASELFVKYEGLIESINRIQIN